ncbi:carbonic anhydrase [Candidatus Micrarchaeota archaeon]|nr:carbonic anhydrase [Candidatus Micrarchaeota archaeon]
MDQNEALSRLMEGNGRFVSGTMEQKNFGPRREELKAGQQPFATVVACSDSRIVPEFIFDVGLGDIFTVVSAGNVVDKIGIGSVEYAVGHLHTPLLVVMGHEKCGAVNAAYHGHGESSIVAIVKKLAPSIKKAKKGGAEEEELDRAAIFNVKAVMRKLKKSPVVKKELDEGRLKIVGMKYHLDGKIEIIA